MKSHLIWTHLKNHILFGVTTATPAHIQTLIYSTWVGMDQIGFTLATIAYDETEDPNHCNVSENNYLSWAPCLVIDGSDVPHIAWTDETGAGLPGPLPFSTPTGGEFETQDWNDDFGGWNASEVYYVTWENSFDGELSLQKSVDSDNDTV
ncbi:MAG: hypothetical protein R2883_06335 [Caldisericia bacterium]